jgi:nicotinamide-nucleotide amidase
MHRAATIPHRAMFDLLRSRKLLLATAESCTGGMVAAAMTEIAGSSEVFDRGFVTYSNEAKMEMLGVPSAVLEKHGAVSAETAEAMAIGALVHSRADVSVSITGVAGPAGGSAAKPVGLVHFAVALRDGIVTLDRQVFADTGRSGIREAARDHALEMVLRTLA